MRTPANLTTEKAMALIFRFFPQKWFAEKMISLLQNIAEQQQPSKKLDNRSPTQRTKTPTTWYVLSPTTWYLLSNRKYPRNQKSQKREGPKSMKIFNISCFEIRHFEDSDKMERTLADFTIEKRFETQVSKNSVFDTKMT